MSLEEATNYLKTHGITVKKDDLGYTVTNAQNVTLRAKEQAIINYAMQLKNPVKAVSLVGEMTREYWK